MTGDMGVIEIIVSIFALLFGGGGIAALVKARQDGRKGIREDTRAEVDSLNARAIAISQAQFDLLVTPLNDKVIGLDRDMKELKAELETQRNKYWDAITYIRTLLLWINRHFPDRADVPTPPATLAEEI